MSTNGIVKSRPSAFNNIDPRAVARREGWNPRFDFGEIVELAESIKETGMLSPIRVKRVTREDGKMFELIDGDRRLTAVELLLEQGTTFPEGIPAFLVGREQDDITSLVQMFTANTGKPFLPLEEAAAYKRMRDAGLTLEQICSRVGRSHMHVGYTMALLEAAPELKEAVAAGEISATTAKDIIKAAGRKNKDAQAVAVQSVKAAPKGQKAVRTKAVVQTTKDKRLGRKTAVMISPEKLAKLTARIAKHYDALAQSEGAALADVDAFVDTISKDDAMTAAFTAGVLQALKAVASMDVKLEL